MEQSRIALVILAFVVLQADCFHIARLSLGPYIQTGYIDGSLPPSCGFTSGRKYYICPSKAAACLGLPPLPSKSSCCAALQAPPCYEAFCQSPQPSTRLQTSGRLSAAPPAAAAVCSPRSQIVSGSSFCDDCW